MSLFINMVVWRQELIVILVSFNVRSRLSTFCLTGTEGSNADYDKSSPFVFFIAIRGGVVPFDPVPHLARISFPPHPARLLPRPAHYSAPWAKG